MFNKFFFAFIIVLALIIVYSIFQKKNFNVDKMFNPQNNEVQPNGAVTNQPSQMIQPTSGSQKTVFLEVSQPVNNTTVGNAAVSVIGKTIPNGSVFVNDQELKADINGNFSTNTTLLEGENEIVIVASDDFGNSAEKDITLNLETAQ
jgi:hypothetical protein